VAKKTNPKLIGGFVIGAIVLAVAAVLAFGGGQFLKPKERAVLFFAGASLSGLDVGSPVTFRGVKVGSVTNINIQYDVMNQDLRIPVHIEVDLDKFQIVSGARNPGNIKALIERGLRAQLQVQSLLTGQVNVDLAFHPETPITLVGAEPGIIEVPTIPSDIALLKANLASVLDKLSKLPLDQIASELLETVKAAKGLVADVDAQVKPSFENLNRVLDQANLTLKEARSWLELRDGEPMQNLNHALVDARRLVDNVNDQVAPLSGDAKKALNSMSVAFDQAQRTLQAVQSSISPDSTLYFEVNRTLRDIQAMSNSIRTFADYLQRHPDAVLTGKR
jgi:paraquat-inducible protein B